MGSLDSVNASAPPSPGVWVPAVTLFDPDTDTLDLPSQSKYYAYLSRHLTGLVILGTNAETFLLTASERKELLITARKAVGPTYPIIAGVGGHSTKQVLEFIDDAKDAGANYALVLPAAYFGKTTTPSVIARFFDEVAEKSPLPIVIYNFPGVCNGVDLDSATIDGLAKRWPGRIVGVKLTCGSVAKIARLSATLPPEKFSTFGGQSDFLIGGLSSGSAGCVAAFGNIFPKTISHIYRLWSQGKTKEALELHQKAALAENAIKGGIASVKYAAAVYTGKRAGIEGAEEKMRPRQPYEEPSEEAKKKIRDTLDGLNEVEESL